MTLLALDTASPRLVIGVSLPDRCHSVVVQPPATHGEVVLAEISSFFGKAGLSLRQLDGVVIGSGPGSFTGTRVGWASALGLAEGLRVPAVAVGSLDALGWCAPSSTEKIWALLDARRGRFYAALVQGGRRVGDYRDGTLIEFYRECPYFLGPEQPKDLPSEAVFYPVENWAEGLLTLGLEKFKRNEVVQPGQGPIYLRPGVESP